MKYVFGVMSNKWSLEASSELVAKIAMSCFIAKNLPIAIYEPKEIAFMPADIMQQVEEEDEQVKQVRLAIKTIKRVRYDKQ